MTKNSQRPVAKIDQPIGPALLDRISWDDLKLFMTVGHTLSFRKAATSTRLSSSTIVRRIERLEVDLSRQRHAHCNVVVTCASVPAQRAAPKAVQARRPVQSALLD
jgi:hypothetical protein